MRVYGCDVERSWNDNTIVIRGRNAMGTVTFRESFTVPGGVALAIVHDTSEAIEKYLKEKNSMGLLDYKETAWWWAGYDGRHKPLMFDVPAGTLLGVVFPSLRQFAQRYKTRVAIETGVTQHIRVSRRRRRSYKRLTHNELKGLQSHMRVTCHLFITAEVGREGLVHTNPALTRKARRRKKPLPRKKEKT